MPLQAINAENIGFTCSVKILNVGSFSAQTIYFYSITRSVMRIFYYVFLSVILITITLCVSAQQATYSSKAKQVVYFSLDQLPESWLRKPKLLKAIDEILPVAIAPLKGGRSCKECKADYIISARVDTVYILTSDVVLKMPYGQMPYTSPGYENLGYAKPRDENVVTFRFKSFLSIWNANGTEVTRLVITDPDEEEVFRVRHNDAPRGKTCSAPVVFMGGMHSLSTLDVLKQSLPESEWSKAANGPSTLPNDGELHDIMASKLKEISRLVERLQN